MRSMTRWRGGLAVWLSLVTAATAADPTKNPAVENVTAADLLSHIQILASDEFEGRAPGTPGEERTVKYLTDQFQKLGLKPGNPDGTFLQEVPLVGFQASAVSGAFRVGARSIDLKYPDDWVAVSRRMAQEVKIENSDVVFVGYGVVAPEYGWDDYKDVDVRGKTIVMLVNDPAVPDPKDPTQLDPALFKGKAMTYYGRWTYKYEIASEKGAAAALLVHETGPAGYPYSVVVGSWGRENFDIRQAVEDKGRVAVEAWIGLEPAKQLFAASGQDFDALKKAALSKDFRPVPLNAKARLSVKSTMREVKSRNVVARLEGSDPERKKEQIIYTAHWDHLGRDDSLPGDKIFNGAADNASGVAALLEIAKAFAKLQPPPKRSILFLALTAEEQGLLGAKYYAEHPLYPLAETLADINMDVINLWGPTHDITSVGLGQSTLDDLLREVAQVQGRVVIPDAEPEKGLFYRSDHFEFAKQGVPALNVKAGVSYVGKPEDFGRLKREEYTQNDYHKVSDQVKPDWDLTGAVEDLKLLWEVGHRLAEGDRFPEWTPSSEFRERREAMLKKYRP
ncbi:M28 family metallopeptidase [Singulisphaera acidiphila]|uniref:Putative aminopeptidase n=1 Tax=Singulisphaera acidiphila (strain ATCC BAA-1392 / DSM 18658 / VKM B-2454 / MOB10) TaxID=886293 RepID=L0DC24_SINAD|nr:M28 family metallopeptidase [Singulisphaera acidiphila]AGA26226.1 putative aminopeptidase [Singulisphaera acidiphila DSM 18658]